MRREISPEELEAVFRIAAKVPDLRQLEKDLAELVRIQVAGLRTIRGNGDEVRPKTVTDLLRLNREGFISREAVAKQLGIKETPVAQPERLSESTLASLRKYALDRLRASRILP